MDLTGGVPSTYRAFILRIWAEEGELTQAASPWRFSLEGIGMQDETPPERRGFVSAEELLAYLRAEMRARASTGAGHKSLSKPNEEKR